ncbi:hypothetical protein ABZ234_31875 [Nocardiopsis sp. NPDC006198]|uniref:hypothetical protein n=1 Tax=Nocardiopsis sp. NPDC006198 TaxID=3154472 RepID=UPI0033A91CE2
MSHTDVLLQALIGHYRRPNRGRDGQLLLTEVTAPHSTRRCDLLRMSTGRTRGIDIHEVKASRGDWRRELADPDKAAAWLPYCSRMWVVAPPGVVRPEELPHGWGLMEPPTLARRRRFTTVVQANTRTPQLTPELMVDIARRVDNVRLGEIERLHQEHREEIARLGAAHRKDLAAERRRHAPATA